VPAIYARLRTRCGCEQYVVIYSKTGKPPLEHKVPLARELNLTEETLDRTQINVDVRTFRLTTPRPNRVYEYLEKA
jgi:hypothetical protein